MPQQPPPINPDPSIVFGKFAGLVNTVTAERLDPNELARAVNVDLDDRGQLHRRRGYNRKLVGRCHSLYATGGTAYAVVDNWLCLINSNFTTVPLMAGFNDDPLSYTTVGDTVYFSSRSNSGKIVAGEVLPWGENVDHIWLSPVVHPTPTLAEVRGKLLGKPPLAELIAYFNGRIYLASGRTLWATELYLYDFIDKTRTFYQFEADITLVGVVTDGLYIGTTDGLWFLSGPTFDKMKRQKVMDSPVIAGSMVDIPAELANPPQVQPDADSPLKISISFLTAAGFCVAQDGGQAYNLTEARFSFPDIERAAAMFRRQDGINQYVAVADGGMSSGAARIGDYLEVELIRAVDREPSIYTYLVIGDHIEATIVGASQ